MKSMKILSKDDNLASYLKELRDQTVIVISAFASGTEGIIDSLIKNANRVELIVGTINSFSSPDFFDYCKKIKNKNFRLSVDFGYQNSTHWKLYLVEPDTVIIGSANFTITGLSLYRDTCIVIQNIGLFDSYKNEIKALKNSSSVINSCQTREFDIHLEKYRASHHRMQSGLTRTAKYNDELEWLKDETNQLIPLLIWESKHSKKTIERAHGLLKDDNAEGSGSGVREFFTYECDESKLPYVQGDVVLCTSNKGSYVDFYSFDRILHDEGTNYIFSFKRKRYARPFPLNNEIKTRIKDRVEGWWEQGLTALNRNEILSK